MTQTNTLKAPGHRIKQKRGQKTYDRLVETSFKLLQQHEFEEITIAELTRAAGYSVGAFYARFRSKDEFFDAMIVEHIADRTKARSEIFATVANDELVHALVEETVTYYWKRRRFWRAALMRSIRDPEFWEPLRRLGIGFADLLVARINERARQPLTKDEDANVRFAFQLLLGTINNAIINRPGPVFIGQAQFIANMARAFRLVSEYDRLMSIPQKPKRKPPAGSG
jgi:AcrR family transcriptional regulator